MARASPASRRPRRRHAARVRQFVQWWQASLDRTRLHLSRPDALLVLSVLGLLTGLAAGAVIVAFRLMVEGGQEALLPGQGPENYEGLPAALRFALPLAGALLLVPVLHWLARGPQIMGVARVMESMAYYQGHLTVRGFLLRFFGAGLAIVSGQSVGREGPHVFLGAATGSLLGQYVSLPNNAIRTLVGCGTAAGIAASFNTPLAGVAFALEVVMLEYSVTSFIPIILAAVSATAVSNAVLGGDVAFELTMTELTRVSELGLVVLLGAAVAVVSVAFNVTLQAVSARARRIAMPWRMLAAGLAMGGLGVLVPQVMGIGYDTVQLVLQGQLAVGLMLLLMAAKIAASSVALGLGVPGGVIGPSLFVGALAGAVVAEVVMLLPAVDGALPVGTFALLGMGAVMSASLQAPLAGLTAMLELTDNPAIILPGMLAVVVAGITAREVFRKESIFVAQLKGAGLEYRSSPVLEALRRRGVGSVMSREFQRVPAVLEPERCRAALEGGPDWLVLDVDGEPKLLMPAVDLARYLEAQAREAAEAREAAAARERGTQSAESAEGDRAGGSPDADAAGAAQGDAGQGPEAPSREAVDLRRIPAQRYQLAAVHLQATLQEAYERLERGDVEALLVERMTAPGIRRLYGVVTRPMIERTYRN